MPWNKKHNTVLYIFYLSVAHLYLIHHSGRLMWVISGLPCPLASNWFSHWGVGVVNRRERAEGQDIYSPSSPPMKLLQAMSLDKRLLLSLLKVLSSYDSQLLATSPSPDVLGLDVVTSPLLQDPVSYIISGDFRTPWLYYNLFLCK